MRFIAVSIALLIGLSAQHHACAEQKVLRFPKIIQGSWQQDAHQCHESDSQDSEERLVITPDAAYMNEETIKPKKITEISRNPLAWRIHAISNIAPKEIQTSADIYVLNSNHLTVTDGKTTGQYTRCQKDRHCPSKDFDAFLNSFLNDENTQRSFTRFPLITIQYDPQNLEGDPKISYLNPSEVEFPLVLRKAELAAKGVLLETSDKSPGIREVSTHSIGSGAYSKKYKFEMVNQCWFLVSSIDAST